MLIFFLLGLLVFPSMLLPILGTALLIFLGLTFIARPVAVFLVMTPFRSSWRQQALTAFAGLRGAESAVFAIIAVNNPGYGGYDVYNIVFCVAVISVAFQGLLLPAAGQPVTVIQTATRTGSATTEKEMTGSVPEITAGIIQKTAAAPAIIMEPDTAAISKSAGQRKLSKGMRGIYAQ